MGYALSFEDEEHFYCQSMLVLGNFAARSENFYPSG
jgi:hypothetical protein